MASDAVNFTVEERKPVWNTKTSNKRWRGELVPESQLYRCTEPKCTYCSPMAWHIKRHLANVHDIGVTFHVCPEPECTFKTKDKYRFNKHRKKPHTGAQSVYSAIAVKYHEERRAREAFSRTVKQRLIAAAIAAPAPAPAPAVDEWGMIAATDVRVEEPTDRCGLCEL